MFEMSNICKAYGDKIVLDNINLSLSYGIYGLLGLNGAGKTTLLNIMTGIMQPDKGTVFYNKIDIRNKKSNFNNKLGYIPQYTSFYPNFTAREFLDYMCVMKNIKKDRKKLVDSMLEMVNLKDSANKKIGSFSGGMRQRVGIAQALINNPDILILDEPTAGLDPKERERFSKLLVDMSENRVVIMATHIVQDIENVTNNILFLKNGKVIEKVIEDDLHDKVTSFFLI